MIIEHFKGKTKCNNFYDIKEILNFRNENGFNEFIISTKNDFPFMIVSVKNNYASLSYFYKENNAGYISINNLPFLDEKNTTTFYTDNGKTEIKIINYSIIKFELALKTIKEFFETNSLPKCIDWEEL